MLYFIVGLGGIFGALTRYLIGISFTQTWEYPFPLPTLLINLIGCFLLSWLITYLSRRKIFPHEVVTGIGTGYIGAFTTFSTFSVESISLIKTGYYSLSLVYILLSLLGGLVTSWLGYQLGERMMFNYKLKAKEDAE
ncbi:fluoride efflux transporter CrcB [Terrilactibacillus sp. BCM23-1]|uniref:Fluoride-specific ion channel FluC n=1 Tax=Terrilactibacillus tamarindi TaxID=2599694 RepID=A0A6N8CUP7_9BACI|nr:fluoride efflux transporter CrcB [Terrilactibacillus tamarindi]MTT32923.1 fluoride efflux transporter CrcB [Terrilactibacillus tamarindi]